jgi:RimJ/RimL family protein N-acetyltransferase
VDSQRFMLETSLQGYVEGTTVPLAIVDGAEVIGRLNLNGVTRGALQSAAVGYWVSPTHQGRGFATRALAEAVALAFGELTCTACRRRPCCTTRPRSRCYCATVSGRTVWRRSI